MFSVYAGSICIHDDSLPTASSVLISPKLVLEENAAGSFTFSLQKDNPGYYSIELMVTELAVYKNGTKIWGGRAVSERKDFLGNREITCEGELAYLNDIVVDWVRWDSPNYSNNQWAPGGNVGGSYKWTHYEILNEVLRLYNVYCTPSRSILAGIVVPTSFRPYVDFLKIERETILQVLMRYRDELGGFFRLRYDNGKRYLDWFIEEDQMERPTNARGANTQTIEFGVNLVDYILERDESNLHTGILPFGGPVDRDQLEPEFRYQCEKYGLSPKNSLYYTNPGVITGDSALSFDNNTGDVYLKSVFNKYGRITRVVDFSEYIPYSDSTNQITLIASNAAKYLHELSVEHIKMELSAFDLSILNTRHEFGNTLTEYDYETDTLTLKNDSSRSFYAMMYGSYWEGILSFMAGPTSPNDMGATTVSYDSESETLFIQTPHPADNTYQEFKLSDNVHIVSEPHNLDAVLPITKIEIPLDEPENTTYQINSVPEKDFTGIMLNGGSVKTLEDYEYESNTSNDVYSESNMPSEIRQDESDHSCVVKCVSSGVRLYAVADYNNFSSSRGDKGAKLWVSYNSGVGADPNPWSSDRKLKYDIDYDVDGDLVDQLKPAYFRLKRDESPHYGFIAQDVEDVTPEIVFRVDVPGLEDDTIVDSYLALNYHEFIPILTAKIQSQEKRIRDLEDKVQTLLELIQNGGESHG